MVKGGRLIIFFTLLFFIFSCNNKNIKSDIQIPKIETPKPVLQQEQKVETKNDFRIENQPINPLQLKRISINVRATPLRDVLFVIARTRD
jgi:hypothetical protein